MTKFWKPLLAIALICALALAGLGLAAQSPAAAAQAERADEFRAVWVATVYRLDYPSQATTDPAVLKRDADAILQGCVDMGMNAVILQVRPSADALYPSELYPWSKYLTGTQGTAPKNGFDPLAYWVERAHALGLELHAWINPFRITKGGAAEFQALTADHPAKLHPDWVVEYEGDYYFNPGLPEVREYIVRGAEELARKYDIDGIHLDDYFYPGSGFADGAAYAKYGKGFSNIGDWRRDNVNQLVKTLGKELGLFTIMDEGPGFPFFLPRGMVLKNTLIDYWRQVHKRYGYVEISTPIMLNRSLWERSGHWDHYKNNMYTTVIDEEDFAVKPMNCPGGMLVYKNEPHSYRDLPLRVGELGLVHRHELSGALHGLFRVRCFTQDDAHIFMTPDQLKDEIKNVVKLFDEVYSVFGLHYEIELSTMPEDHIGTVEQWEHNQDILKEAITEMGKTYVINEGDGAFYGPKLDFHLADSLGRTWQCGTIQLDSQLPERFELEYVGADNEKHRPIMIHRVVLGSIERFIGVITEHFAGAFPTWLAPVQVKVLPITDRAAEYADQVAAKLDALGYRVETDHRSEKIGFKIRQAQLEKVPYMLVVGDKEAETGDVAVRNRHGGQTVMSFDAFAAKLRDEVDSKALEQN